MTLPEIKPCGQCGVMPEVDGCNVKYPSWQIRCINDKCAKPRTEWHWNKLKAIVQWNKEQE